MRQRSDRQSIERFLESLGRRFARPGRLYLVGGKTLVYERLRRQTLDIDISFEVDRQDPVEYRRKFEILTELWLNSSVPEQL